MNPLDMSAYIVARSDQLNADDLMDSPKTITITKVTASPETAEQPVSIHYEGGEGKVFKPCKTVRRIMVGVWGADASKYVGRSMTLYRDPTVSFGGMQVGGIRVSHMSHIDGDKTVALLVTRGRKAPFKVKPLKTSARTAEPQTDAFGLAPVTDGPAAPTPQRTPRQWVDAYKASLDKITSSDHLADFAEQRRDTLDRLKASDPELWEETQTAYRERLDAMVDA